jgi:platelet-activating factor acetylhydrolase IB subunit alpha
MVFLLPFLGSICRFLSAKRSKKPNRPLRHSLRCTSLPILSCSRRQEEVLCGLPNAQKEPAYDLSHSLPYRRHFCCCCRAAVLKKMSLLLTDRQRVDLNSAILDYLLSQPDAFAASAAAFQQESGVTLEAGASSKGLLEKKWTSVVRLQRKVMELEAKVESLQHRGIGAEVEGKVVKVAMGDSKMLPRPPAKKSMSGHRAGVTAVATHPIYSFFASGSEDCTIRMWDHETCQYERTLKGHTGSITGLAFDARGSLLASCSADMSCKLWDMSTFACSKTLKGHDHTISGVVFLPSGDQVLTCSRDQTSKLWEVASGFCLRTYSSHSDWVKCISISLDGRNFSTGSVDQTIIVWDVSSTQPLQTLRGHEHVVESVCYGKKPRDAAAIMASTAASEGGAGELIAVRQMGNCVECGSWVGVEPWGRGAPHRQQRRTANLLPQRRFSLLSPSSNLIPHTPSLTPHTSSLIPHNP